MTLLSYLTGASILALREREQYLALACNCHFSVELDSVEFGGTNGSIDD
jgi:hypothetical protein